MSTKTLYKNQVVTHKGTHLYIRTGPSTSYKILGKLDSGTILWFDEKKGDWYKHKDKNQWSCGDYMKVLEVIKPTPPPPPAPPPKPTPPKPAPANPAYDAMTEILKQQELGGSISFKNYLDIQGAGVEHHKDLDTSYSIPQIRTAQNMSKSFISEKQSSLTTAMVKDAAYANARANLDVIRYNMNFSYGSAAETEVFERFERSKHTKPDRHLSKTFSHVFFTRPDLNLTVPTGLKLHAHIENDPLFYYIWKNKQSLVLSLTNYLTKEHDFNTFLSNEATSFEVSDEYIKTVEHGETFTGHKVVYGGSSTESKTAGQFNIMYEDNTNFDIYKMHKMWITYISMVKKGVIRPKDGYIPNKVLDYACAVYYFVCGPDNETILFWTKYTGVFPTNAPSSVSSWTKDSKLTNPEVTINYMYSCKEDFTPLSLAEFNMNSHDENYTYRKNYNTSLGHSGNDSVRHPFVETTTDSNGKYIFKLKYRN